MPTDEELSQLAEAALLAEAKRGALRAEMAGPSGWLKPKLLSTNKLFLQNTIRGAVASNEMKDKKRKIIRTTKLEEFEEELKEKKRYKKQYLKASTKEKDPKAAPIKKKKDSEKVLTKSVNGISWNEEDDSGGLEISCSIPTTVKKKTPKIQFNMPRNIKFVSGNKNKSGIT